MQRSPPARSTVVSRSVAVVVGVALLALDLPVLRTPSPHAPCFPVGGTEDFLDELDLSSILSWVLSTPDHPSNKSVRFPGRKTKHAWFECGELGRKSKITSPVNQKKKDKNEEVSGCDVVVEGPWSTFEGLGGVTMTEEDKRAEPLETCHSTLTNTDQH